MQQWRGLLNPEVDNKLISTQMKLVNPKYTWREWLVVPAYEQAEQGDYALIDELQSVFAKPYSEQDKSIEEKYDQLRPLEYFCGWWCFSLQLLIITTLLAPKVFFYWRFFSSFLCALLRNNGHSPRTRPQHISTSSDALFEIFHNIGLN
ncbi:hypothetical protein QW180_18730 [Vibrio sinaloensis]|nr:hypothetical protein [Vibrio sinaloensis]